MAISLQKGQKVNLTKENAGLKAVRIGLGWDQAQAEKKGFLGFGTKTAQVDCDASAILLQGGKFKNNEDIVYFGNLRHKSDSVMHMGDNLTGAGDGDDEQVLIDLQRIPPQYDRIVMVVNIYAAEKRNQHFGMIQNAFIRVVDANSNVELYRYNLTENYAGMLAMLFGELYRDGNEWKFSALGQGTSDKNLSQLLHRFV